MTSSAYQPLQYQLRGKQGSQSIIIFMQGWPDNNQVWEPLEWLLFINFPNTSTTQQKVKWGQDFPVIIERIKATFDQVKVSSFKKKLIVCHDWGCFYSYMFDQAYPGQVNQIIAMDVPAYVQLANLKAIIFVLVYQMILITGFLFGGFIGRFLTKGICKVMKYSPKYIDDIDGSRNYPYFYLYINKFKSALNKSKSFLYRYKPSVPIVYLYANKKPFSFHGDRWLNYLKQNQKCEAHGLQCGHWIMNKYSTFITELIIRRIKSI